MPCTSVAHLSFEWYLRLFNSIIWFVDVASQPLDKGHAYKWTWPFSKSQRAMSTEVRAKMYLSVHKVKIKTLTSGPSVCRVLANKNVSGHPHRMGWPADLPKIMRNRHCVCFICSLVPARKLCMLVHFRGLVHRCSQPYELAAFWIVTSTVTLWWTHTENEKKKNQKNKFWIFWIN